ncbi:unnamed protein product [Caenorhabditis bovis]|uniref:Uncharacterized protein n=1 Tax=Caenorhabditis bovis TaxID=2654633 RepID=A0A8S1E6J7_9PELO|nr:unnamed protein product [Caenorhabditis bovis]
MYTVFVAFFLFSFRIASGAIKGPLSDDFQKWLKRNGYDSCDFARSDYGTQGSYGGKTVNVSEMVNIPVVFVHGNSDAALHRSSSAPGWSNSIEYFLANGYTQAELYATSWQDSNPLNASKRKHDCETVTRIRKFFEAVLSYTGSKKISIVSHSMGVTIARKAVKGGRIEDADGQCNIGLPLNKKIEVFVGLSGANFGLCNCEGPLANLQKTCNKQDGFWPGDSCGSNKLNCGVNPLPSPCTAVSYSKYLMQLNSDRIKEADYVFSVWSYADELIGYSDMVWGRATSLIPLSDGKINYSNLTHMESKDNTFADQYQMVKFHIVPTNN